MTIAFDNSYARLPDRFFAEVAPTPVAAPGLIRVNRALARHLNLDPEWLSGPEGVEMLAGNKVPPGARPVAMAYAGHQFGNFVPQLGDGRAVLLGEVIDRDGVRRDIQLKGAGRTPFSRHGDGRAPLGPVLREYIVSEAMAAMSIPTTRALAAVTTGDTVIRERFLPGAVLARVARSHIRVGTFQFFAARRDVEAIRLLADHAIARHYPHLAEAENPFLALLEQVIAVQADLVARWMSVGFIHGVLNTDNTAIAGETIDYGPCAFMDDYRTDAVFSSIDQTGRYAYANQPRIVQWNLTRFAECLIPLIDDDSDKAIDLAQERLSDFMPRFESAWQARMRPKLGLATEHDDDAALIRDLLDLMAANGVDFTLGFRHLGSAAADPAGAEEFRALFADSAALEDWMSRWTERLDREPMDGTARRAAMDGVNPLYIPRNHLVEAAIVAAEDEGDFGPFEELLEALSEPYEARPGFDRFTLPPEPHERVLQTFCGT